MPYTIGLFNFDLGQFFPGTRTPFGGVLDVPAVGPPEVATESAGSRIVFATPPSRPTSAGTLLITDPAGPGDVFRSGPVGTWAAEPAAVNVFTLPRAATGPTGLIPNFPGTALSFSVIAARVSLPVSTPIPGYITAAIGLLTGGWFIPFNITIRTLILGRNPTSGAIRVVVTGTIGYVRFFIPMRERFSGTLDIVVRPSGDATNPTAVFAATASNLNLTMGVVSPSALANLILLLAPLFSDLLSAPIATGLNTIVMGLATPAIAAAAATPGIGGGPPIISTAATVSARRVTVLSSGVILDLILSELVALPAAGTGTDPGTGNPPPVGADILEVRITPPPERDVTHDYQIRVTRRSDHSPVADVEITLVNFDPIGVAAVTDTAHTDTSGLVTLAATLRVGVRINPGPVNAGQLTQVAPRLTASKTGFQTVVQELLGVI